MRTPSAGCIIACYKSQPAAIAGKRDAIIADVGGQWSDLKGGFTEKVLQGTEPVLFRPLIGPRRRFCDEPITTGEP
jgi:hypothetical protein